MRMVTTVQKFRIKECGIYVLYLQIRVSCVTDKLQSNTRSIWRFCDRSVRYVLSCRDSILLSSARLFFLLVRFVRIVEFDIAAMAALQYSNVRDA